MKNLLPWQAIAMNVAAVGTVITFAKFIFLPHTQQREQLVKPGFWPAVTLLITGLVAANVIYLQAYNIADITKAIAIIGGGWLAYTFIFKRVAVYLPRVLEEFDHLIGAMSLILILVFWMALA
jgi:multicomponent Na+:H+ antiporter subunit D